LPVVYCRMLRVVSLPARRLARPVCEEANNGPAGEPD
jgi:hypothetical protein